MQVKKGLHHRCKSAQGRGATRCSQVAVTKETDVSQKRPIQKKTYTRDGCTSKETYTRDINQSRGEARRVALKLRLQKKPLSVKKTYKRDVCTSKETYTRYVYQSRGEAQRSLAAPATRLVSQKRPTYKRDPKKTKTDPHTRPIKRKEICNRDVCSS